MGYTAYWSERCGGLEPVALDVPTSMTIWGQRVVLGPDADGDGLADILVSAPQLHDVEGRVLLLSGLTQAVVQEWTAPAERGFGAGASLGPDADGDGLGDVAIGDAQGMCESGLTLYSGVSGGLLQDWPALVEECLSYEGDTVMLGPDVDGDGRADLATGRRRDGRWSAGVVLSGATGAVLREWPTNAMSRAEPQIGPDLDEDGRADIAVGHWDAEMSREWIAIESSGSGAELARWEAPAGNLGFGHVVRPGADADGDGAGDLLVVTLTADGDPRVWLAETGDLSVRRLVPAVWGSLGLDLGGDGLADVAALTTDGQLVLLDGTSGRVRRTFDGLGRCRDVSLGPDADGDLRADVVVGGCTGGIAPAYLLLSSR